MSELMENFPKFTFEIIWEGWPFNFNFNRSTSDAGMPKVEGKSKVDPNDRGHGLDIYHCLEEHRKSEILDKNNTWYCSKCKSHVQATKKTSIFNAPEHLVFHFKRFKTSARRGWGGRAYGSRSKDCSDIWFPAEGLDMSDYVLN